MQINKYKKDEAIPKKTLALKKFDSDEEIELDEEQVAFVIKNFGKFFKMKKGIGIKKCSNDHLVNAKSVVGLITKLGNVLFGKLNEKKK